MDDNKGFCDSGIVEDKCVEYLGKHDFPGVCEDLVNSIGRFSSLSLCADDSPELSDGSTNSSRCGRLGNFQSRKRCFISFKDLRATKIPIATWRRAELEFFSTKIPIAKWRLKEFYMEKKNTIYRGTATSFGFKRPVSAPNNVKPPAPTVNAVPQPQESVTNSAESVVTAPTARSGTPRLARPMKETNGTNIRTNRFGFRPATALSNKVADSQNITSKRANHNLEVSKAAAEDASAKHLARSHLPRPQQFPVRLAAPANYRAASADKSAKTAANNHTARRSRSENNGSSASSVNDADSGVGSQKSGNELEMIEQLECSPSARNRFRNKQKSRPMEMVFGSGNEKKFELRDLRDSIEVTEIMQLQLPPLPLAKTTGSERNKQAMFARQISRDNNSPSSEDDEGIEDEPGEEKLHRDRVLSEKDERGVIGAGEEAADGEDLWGHGEAMAGEEEMTTEQEGIDSDRGCQPPPPPLRSVLLSIEDHSFAALAAMSSSAMIEDECYPELPDIPNSLSLTITSTVTTPNSPPEEVKQEEKKNSDDSPGTPGSPTHTSNSLSLSSDIRDRDFIDDEICDQPGLVYDNVAGNNSSGNTLIADDLSCKAVKPLSALSHLTVDCGGSARHSSVGTLSPCDSIASDDLMMDYDISGVDDDHRLDTSSLDLALTDGEADEQSEQALQELSTMLSSRPELMNGVRATRHLRTRVDSSASGAESPRSLDTPRLRTGSALSSPLRSSRQGTSSPGEDISEDSGIRVQRGTYQSMYQDVINIKAQLLRLQRVIQANEADNTHEIPLKNGYYNNSTSDGVGVDSKSDEHELIADLQRQVVFLQSQVEEKDRTIRTLQTTLPPPPEPQGQAETCNAATQTERVRPLSTGPILSTQPDSAGGSFVSITSECTRPRPVSRLPQWRRSSSPSRELHKASVRRITQT